MRRPLILDEPCIGNTKKELINTVRFHWVKEEEKIEITHLKSKLFH